MKRGAAQKVSLGSCESGSAAVEFAFIGMLLIAGSLMAIDLGRAFWLYNKLSDAMERAARMSLVQAATNDQIRNEILKDFPASGTSTSSVETPTVAVTSETEFRTVKVDLLFRTIVPAFVGESFNLSLTRRFPKAPPPSS